MTKTLEVSHRLLELAEWLDSWQAPNKYCELSVLEQWAKDVRSIAIPAPVDNKEEQLKADLDLAAFGTSGIVKDADGNIRHIPINELFIK